MFTFLSKWKDALKSAGHRAGKWFGYFPFEEKVLIRRVPRTPWYHGDGATLMMLLTIQVVTGITMTLYYTNSAEYAYDSVRFITEDLSLGRLLRAIHYWTAGIMVTVVVIHVFRHLLAGGYKAPREGTWIIGVFQFFLIITMSFTGYVLRWDERAVYAARVSLNMFYKVPWIGEELVLLVQGGPQLGATTLTRIFSVHIWIVPIMLLSLVGIHLYLVILHGVTSKAESKVPITSAEEQKKVYKAAAESEEEGEWFHVRTVAVIGSMAFLVFVVMYVIALSVGPRAMYPEGNLIRPAIPVEEWWFGWYSSAIALMPPMLSPVFLVGFPLALFAFMFLLPFVDRGPNRGRRNRPFWTAFVVFLVVALLYLSGLRIKSPWTGWPDGNPPPTPHGLVLSAKSEMGRQNFANYGCNSCHSIASHGRRVGPDLARLENRRSQAWLRDFVLAPPAGVAMPAYKGHITDEALDQVVDYVLVAQTFPRD